MVILSNISLLWLDIYTRIAVALIDGHIDIHEALTYQEDTLKGLHTARSGIFIRDFPGRLVLYPFEAATCAVIFFGGDFTDAGVAALCGFATGFVEMCLGFLSGQFRELKILTDVIVGITTGLIGGLFYNYSEEGYCLRSIFLGTLYWFFYGTAFVIGILEIIAGELETGVTRFIAVSVKTFVLSLGAAIGLMLATSSNASTVWFESQDQYCGKLDLSMYWWRIPLYLLCSASVLAQYRFPIVQYWRGLIVQLCAYEVQYQWFAYSQTLHGRDYLDTSTSNILGAAAGVISACILSYIINTVKLFYSQRLLQEKNSKNTKFGNIVFGILALGVNIGQSLHLGRKSDFLKLDISTQLQQQRQEINDTTHPRQEMELSKQEENLILETIVGSQELNVWSILMPALYQLVPGSIIAQLWFNSIFPPDANTDGSDAVFSNLMVISTSLALGLIIGFTSVQVFGSIFLRLLTPGKSHDEKIHALARLAGMYSAPATILDDPVTSGGPNQRSEQDGHSNQGAGRNYSLVDDKQNHHEISVEDPFFPVPLDGDEI